MLNTTATNFSTIANYYVQIATAKYFLELLCLIVVPFALILIVAKLYKINKNLEMIEYNTRNSKEIV